MKNIDFRDLLYAVLCLSFSIIVGAGIFESIAIWPNTYAAPPASLAMFQGEYPLNSGIFWSLIHPVTLVLFIIGTIITWKTPRRKHVWIACSGYILILIITALYFVPELMSITGTPFSDVVDKGLQERGVLWINLNLIRTLIMMSLTIILYLGLKKSGTKIHSF